MVTACAILAALALAVGTTGVLSFLTGQDSGFANSLGLLGSSLLWLAVGSLLLYFVVRKRSTRIWVVTLRVLGGTFIVLAGTTTHGNLTGYLEYRNWIALALSLVCIGIAAMLLAWRTAIETRESTE